MDSFRCLLNQLSPSLTGAAQLTPIRGGLGGTPGNAPLLEGQGADDHHAPVLEDAHACRHRPPVGRRVGRRCFGLSSFAARMKRQKPLVRHAHRVVFLVPSFLEMQRPCSCVKTVVGRPCAVLYLPLRRSPRNMITNFLVTTAEQRAVSSNLSAWFLATMASDEVCWRCSRLGGRLKQKQMGRKELAIFSHQF